MLESMKMLVKTPFRLCGLDIKRYRPQEPERVYGWLMRRDISTVIDIGANTGQFAKQIHKIIPTATIFSFEPIEACYDKLVRNMSEVPKFYAFNYAIGDADTDMEMHVNDYTPSSSLLPMADLHVKAFPHTSKEHRKKVKVRRLDKVVRELQCDGNLLIKMDVQGYEDRVIRGGQSVISRAKVLIVETSFQCLYVGQPLFKGIYDILVKMGFTYVGALTQLRSRLDGSVLQADSIFVMEENE